MDPFDSELLVVINRLKEHRNKKAKLLEQEGIDQATYWNAKGRLTALDHALLELDYLYHTGKSKPKIE